MKIDRQAATVFENLVEAVPGRVPSKEAIRAIMRDASPRTARKELHSSLPIAAAALAIFMLVPFAAGDRGPSLAETATVAYENGVFERYGNVIFEALTR